MQKRESDTKEDHANEQGRGLPHNSIDRPATSRPERFTKDVTHDPLFRGTCPQGTVGGIDTSSANLKVAGFTALSPSLQRLVPSRIYFASELIISEQAQPVNADNRGWSRGTRWNRFPFETWCVKGSTKTLDVQEIQTFVVSISIRNLHSSHSDRCRGLSEEIVNNLACWKTGTFRFRPRLALQGVA